MTETIQVVCDTCRHVFVIARSQHAWTCPRCKQEHNTARDYWHPEGPLAEFDAALVDITQRRGVTYGHPADDFQRVAAMKRALPSWVDQRLQHIAEMILVKLARLATTPTHVDSLVDIAGYARCWAMILERDYDRKTARDANQGFDIPPVPGDRETPSDPHGACDSNDGGHTSAVGGPRRTGDRGARSQAADLGTAGRPRGD